MTRNELRELIALGEDSRRQFKVNVTNTDTLAADLVAFSNGNGYFLTKPLQDADIDRVLESIAAHSADSMAVR